MRLLVVVRSLIFGSILIGGAGSGVSAQKTTADLRTRFEAGYGKDRRYEDIGTAKLNGRNLLLAYWLRDGSPLQLSVDIFVYHEDAGALVAKRIYSGGVAEEVRAVVTLDLNGDAKDELVFVRNSGQIQLICVLEDHGDSLKQIFENGGSDITILRSPKQIWLKSRSAKVIEVFQWDAKLRRIVRIREYPLIL